MVNNFQKKRTNERQRNVKKRSQSYLFAMSYWSLLLTADMQ